MIIHGINSVREAVASGMQVREIYVSDRMDERIREVVDMAMKRDMKIKRKDRNFFKGVGGQSAQFLAAKVDIKTVTVDEMIAGAQTRLFVVLDQIEDPRNLGAIIRSASAVGVDGVVIQTHRAAGLTPVVFSASAGAVAHVKLAEVPNVKNALRVFRDEGYWIVGAESEGPKPYWDMDFSGPLIIVMGSEGKGLRRTVKDLCDELVHIPMSGTVSSLNVSVATAVLLFEVLRQKKRKT